MSASVGGSVVKGNRTSFGTSATRIDAEDQLSRAMMHSPQAHNDALLKLWIIGKTTVGEFMTGHLSLPHFDAVYWNVMTDRYRLPDPMTGAESRRVRYKKVF